MTNINFGFLAFEKCFHCEGLRTYFSTEASPHLGEEYREGDHFWSIIENAQTFRFDLKCTECGHVEEFHDLMGLLYCTSCMPNCRVEILQKELEADKTWVTVAFGHLPRTEEKQILPEKLSVLTDFFNQRRDTSRSRMKIVSFDLIENLGICKGEFIHDVGMLSQEPPEERKPLL
jgi:hypothetical protein